MTDKYWSDQAECAYQDTDLFYPSVRDKAAVTRAKAICARCPVLTECLVFALQMDDLHAVMGGMTPVERRRLLAYHNYNQAKAIRAVTKEVSVRGTLQNA